MLSSVLQPHVVKRQNLPPVLVTLPDTVLTMPGEIGELVQKQHVEQLVSNLALDMPGIYKSMIIIIFKGTGPG